MARPASPVGLYSRGEGRAHRAPTIPKAGCRVSALRVTIPSRKKEMCPSPGGTRSRVPPVVAALCSRLLRVPFLTGLGAAVGPAFPVTRKRVTGAMLTLLRLPCFRTPRSLAFAQRFGHVQICTPASHPARTEHRHALPPHHLQTHVLRSFRTLRRQRRRLRREEDSFRNSEPVGSERAPLHGCPPHIPNLP
jgi:hypothetical protein